MRLLRIVSGGQTGADRAALDAALAAGFECGGWCPEGRLVGTRWHSAVPGNNRH
ncbi:YpsA SLOG family protein [Aerolutibacter ruishenii]|uniref:YpsA SLOG family protein n=1 Tax=Aerolutibacter ruishenii TaxID=686800 RepID=UPI003CCE41E4